MKPTVLDLFSGIGGFSLGLERAGFKTVAFCEIDPFCRRVLARHWPGVPCYDDVTTLTVERLAADGIVLPIADATREQAHIELCGPHQLSGQSGAALAAGAQTTRQEDGETGNNDTTRLCKNTGIDVICGGFPCQDISQAGKGAGITGSRSGLWREYARIIGEVRPKFAIIENVSALLHRGLSDVLYDLSALGYNAEWHCIPASAVGAPHRRDRIWIVAYPNGGRGRWLSDSGGDAPNPDSQPQGRLAIAWGECGHWLVESDVDRVAHGVPNRVDRLRALGNAVVPQIPELIGRAIITRNWS